MSKSFTLEQKKRIEIVLPIEILDDLVESLTKVGITGYTVIPGVLGSGERGIRSSVSLGSFQYNYLIMACKEDEVEKIVEQVTPYLNSYGGICSISDTQTVVH